MAFLRPQLQTRMSQFEYLLLILLVLPQITPAFLLGPSLDGRRLFVQQDRPDGATKERGARNLSNEEEVEVDGKPIQVVVVGGGVGGLAVASRVASSMAGNNVRVTVLEKNASSKTGGRCGSFDVKVGEDLYRHERGPSLLLLKGMYDELWKSCCSRLETAKGEHFRATKCVPAYRVVFDDGDGVDLGFPEDELCDNKIPTELLRRREKSVETLNSYEADGASKWDDYMAATAAFLDCGLPNFIEEKLDLGSFPAFLWEATKNFGRAWPLRPHSDVVDEFFESNKMRAMATFQNLYVGLQPYRQSDQFGGGVFRKTAPAVFGLLAAIELHPTNRNAGVYAPIGGFRSVATAMENLAESCGVELVYNATVCRVQDDMVYYNHRHSASTSSEQEESVPVQRSIRADVIVINADLPYATQCLFTKTIGQNTSLSSFDERSNHEETYDWDDSYDFSSGVVAFHWCIANKKLGESLNTHNVFLVANDRRNAERSWRALSCSADDDSMTELTEADSKPEPFNFYVHRPVVSDPSAAPNHGESLMILVPCKPLLRKSSCTNNDDTDMDVDVDALREAVYRRLAVLPDCVDLRDHVVHETVETPRTYAKSYHVAAGVPFGLSHGFNQLSLTRPPHEHSHSVNDRIYYVGASTRPGNGVPLVLIGAKAVAEKVVRRVQAIL